MQHISCSIRQVYLNVGFIMVTMPFFYSSKEGTIERQPKIVCYLANNEVSIKFPARFRVSDNENINRYAKD